MNDATIEAGVYELCEEDGTPITRFGNNQPIRLDFPRGYFLRRVE